jgi:hypothetical protein
LRSRRNIAVTLSAGDRKVFFYSESRRLSFTYRPQSSPFCVVQLICSAPRDRSCFAQRIGRTTDPK